jgi:hypothetical protein
MQQPSSSEKCRKINVIALVALCCILLHGSCCAITRISAASAGDLEGNRTAPAWKRSDPLCRTAKRRERALAEAGPKLVKLGAQHVVGADKQNSQDSRRTKPQNRGVG